MIEIITRAVAEPRASEEMEDAQGVVMDEGSTVHAFCVTDPQSRYLPMPWEPEKIRSDLWYECHPLCLRVYCKGEQLEAYRQYFENNGCWLSETKDYIQPKRTYYSVYKCDAANDMLIELIKADESVTSIERRCKWQVHRLMDPYSTELVNGHQSNNMPRMLDACFDFSNVKDIIFSGKSTDPSVYTKSNPLVITCLTSITVVPEDPEQPVYMTMMCMGPKLRSDFRKQIYHMT